MEEEVADDLYEVRPDISTRVFATDRDGVRAAQIGHAREGAALRALHVWRDAVQVHGRVPYFEIRGESVRGMR